MRDAGNFAVLFFSPLGWKITHQTPRKTVTVTGRAIVCVFFSSFHPTFSAEMVLIEHNIRVKFVFPGWAPYMHHTAP